MSNLYHKALIARLLTPMQDCKICSSLDREDPESGKDECKAGVLEKLDMILCDGQDDLEDEIYADKQAQMEDLLQRIIKLKKICFECYSGSAALYDLYCEFSSELEEHSDKKTDKERMSAPKVRKIFPKVR